MVTRRKAPRGMWMDKITWGLVDLAIDAQTCAVRELDPRSCRPGSALCVSPVVAGRTCCRARLP